MSESLAISAILEWKISWSFLFLYSKTNTEWTLNLLTHLIRKISLDQKDLKPQYYNDVLNYQKNLIPSSQRVFYTSPGVLRKI